MMSRDDATTRRPRGPEAAAGEVWSADLERPHQHSSQGVPTFFSPAASFGAPQNPDARTRRFWIWISFGESRGPTRSGENQNHTADIFISPRKIESDGGGRGASLRRRQDTTALRELAGKDEHHLRWKRSVRDRALERQAPFLLACAIRHDALGGSVELPKGKHSGRPRVGQRAREFHDGLPGCAAIPRSQRLRVFRGHGAREEPDDVALPRGGGEAEKGESFSFPPRGFRRARKKKMPSWPLPSSGCWRRVLTDFRVSFARALSPCMTHAFHSSQRAQVEAAYDVVLMRSLMKRSQGEVSDNRVKYADVLSPGAVVKKKLPPWARDMSSKLPPRPAVEAPEGEILTQGGIALAVLSVLIIAQGCSQVRFKDLFFPRCERPSRADDTPMLHLPTADS